MEITEFFASEGQFVGRAMSSSAATFYWKSNFIISRYFRGRDGQDGGSMFTF